MDVVALLHRIAEWLVPARAASVAILAAVLATLLCGARRRGAGRLEATGLALLALGAIPALADWPWWLNLALLVAVSVLALVHLRAAPAGEPGDAAGRSARFTFAAVAGPLLIAVLLVVPGLGSYAGTLLLWEGEVVDGFATAFRAGLDPLARLGGSFLWNEGALTEGHSSLVFGGITYPLLLHVGFTVSVLRAVAAACGLLAVPLLYLQARRWLPPGAAVLATAAWSLSTTVLLYARYGTSLSATLLTLLLATFAVGTVRERGARSWWPAPLAAAALIVATLHYAPGRLVAVLLLVAAVCFLARDARRMTGAGVIGALLAGALLAGFVALQVRHGRTVMFFHAHGEQVFSLIEQPHQVAAYLGPPRAAGPADRSRALAFGAALVRANLPDLARLVGVIPRPEPRPEPGWSALVTDPPRIPLFLVPLLPFLALGVARSLRGVRNWPHGLLVAWTVVTVGAVMLSNRIDHHRLVTLAVPICLWLGVGLWHGLGILRRSGLPRAALAALLGGLAVAALLEAAWQLNRPRPVAGSRLVAATAQALRSLDGPVVAAYAADVRERFSAQLLLLERERSLGLPPHEPLRLRLQQALDDPQQRPRFTDTLVLAIGNAVGNGTLLLGPAADTQALAGGLQAQGFRVRRLDGPVGLFVVTAANGGISGP